MKIEAKVLQDALAFLGLGISKNVSDRPITKMLELCTENGFLVGTTCDGLTSIRLKICATTEDIKALVEFEFFNNIIKACTDEVELKQATNALSIKSTSMKCKVPSMYDRPSTSMPHLPMVACTNDADFSSLASVLPICKSIVNPSFSIECYRYVYLGDKVMVTDTDNVAVVNKKFFNDSVLLSYKSIEILSKLTTAKYTITNEVHARTKKDFKKLYIQTDAAEIVCLSNYMDLFQYDDLCNLFSLPENDSIVISKESLSKGYNVAKLFKNSKILLVFDTDKVFFKIAQSDFEYIICNVGIKDAHTYRVTDDLMKRILTLSGEIKISLLDNMFKCVVGDTEEIFSAEEVVEMHNSK